LVPLENDYFSFLQPFGWNPFPPCAQRDDSADDGGVCVAVAIGANCLTEDCFHVTKTPFFSAMPITACVPELKSKKSFSKGGRWWAEL
jgi:hypothetical protein